MGILQRPEASLEDRWDSAGEPVVLTGIQALVRLPLLRRQLDAALGLPDTVFIEVMMDRHEEESLRRFEDAVQAIPEVLECHLVTGEYDYVIKAAVAGTVGHEKLLRERLYRLPGVRHTRTSFALRCLKQTRSPVPEG